MLGTDYLAATEIAKRLAERVGGILVPVTPFGFSPLHADYAGTISLRSETMAELLYDLLSGLAKNGFKAILMIHGHDGNIPVVETVAQRFKTMFPDVFVASTTWWELTKDDEEVRKLYGMYGGKGHGAAEEISVSMVAAPGHTDLKEAEDQEPMPEMPEMPSKILPFPYLQHALEVHFGSAKEFVPKGFEGSARDASEEKGEVSIRKVVDILTRFVEGMKKRGWKVR
jgi:creatinine amidohydrolase